MHTCTVLSKGTSPRERRPNEGAHECSWVHVQCTLYDIIEYYYNVNPLLCVCAFAIGAKKLEHSVGERDRRDGKSQEQNFSGMVKGNRKRNHVNVKHVIDKTESITVEGIIAVKFNSKCYKASVILTWLTGWCPRSVTQRRRSPPTAPRQMLSALSERKFVVVHWRRCWKHSFPPPKMSDSFPLVQRKMRCRILHFDWQPFNI